MSTLVMKRPSYEVPMDAEENKAAIAKVDFMN
jgi:hypothetical protein